MLRLWLPSPVTGGISRKAASTGFGRARSEIPRLRRCVPLGLLLGSLATLGESVQEPRIEAILSTWTNDDVVCDYVRTHSANGGVEIVERYSMADG